MIQRFLIAIVFSFTGCAISIAQPVNKDDINRCIDYVNCRYTQIYIEFNFNTLSENCKQIYDKSIKKELSSTSLHQDTMNFRKLTELLKDSCWNNIRNEICHKIDLRKGISHKEAQEKLIDSITSINDIKALSDIPLINILKREIQITLKGYFNTITQNKNESIHNDITDIQINNILRWIKNPLVWSCTFIIIIFITILSYIISLVNKPGRYKKSQHESQTTTKQNDSSYKKTSTNSNVCITTNESNHIKNKQKGESISKTNPQSEENPKDAYIDISYVASDTSLKYEYLRTAHDGIFRRKFSNPNTCYFRCWETSQGTFLFEFSGNEEYAIANESAILENICEIQRESNSPTHIQTMIQGELDENLKVIKKTTIKLY